MNEHEWVVNCTRSSVLDHREVGRYWEGNAELWTRLARQGYDSFRDLMNNPVFFELLPDVTGLDGLDVGCGEGHNTRLLALRGARMKGIDISPTFIRLARDVEATDPLGIEYHETSAISLPFADAEFDFATAFMSLMDFAETDQALREIHRVLRPGGFLQFSITHPCFDTPHRRRVRDEQTGRTRGFEIGGYFDRVSGRVSEWSFNNLPPDVVEAGANFRVPYFRRTLADWINMLSDSGLTIEHIAEPEPDPATFTTHPEFEGADQVAYFLHLRVRKGHDRAGQSRLPESTVGRVSESGPGAD